MNRIALGHMKQRSRGSSWWKSRERGLFFSLALFGLLTSAALVSAVNNDGKTDIYWRNYSSGDNAAWAMNGVAYWWSQTLPFVGDTDWKIVGTGDFNNDGEIDLLWRNASTGGNVVWFMTGGSYRSSAVLQSMTDTSWEVVGTGYFDEGSDSNIDILWRNSATGDNAIWYLEGTELVSSVLIQEVPDLDWKVGGTGDFNNDGSTDIVWRHQGSGVNYVWLMRGGNLVTPVALQSEASSNWTIAGAGYFSGQNDNTVDLLWRNISTGDNAIWQMNGTTYVSSHTLPWAALAWEVGGTGDAKVDTDSDGLPDLWERRYFGNLAQSGSSDPDSDSQNNSTEYNNGTNPTLNNSLPVLGNAVENNTLIWTSGGNAPWFHTTADSYTGGDSARSGSIGHNQTTWMETEVLGPGTFSYYWRVSSYYYGNDSFSWIQYKPGGTSASSLAYAGEYPWANRTITLVPGVNRIRFVYSKDAYYSGGQDCAYVDNVQVTYTTTGLSNLADAVDDFGGEYGTSQYSPWYRVSSQYYNAGDSAESYSNLQQGQSILSTIVTGPGTISFYWRVSSEEDYDFLRFRIGGFTVAEISGFVDWEQRSFTVPSGPTSLAWSFDKDATWQGGLDRGWVDQVEFVSDTDVDGLADDWETQYFGSTASQTGDGDFDADGLNNLLEYLNGTDPTSPELAIRIASPRQSSLLP